MRTIFARVLLTMSLAITTLFPQEIFGSSVEKRVLFPKGKGTLTFRGKLPREFDYDAYVFAAKKGRYVTVKLISATATHTSRSTKPKPSAPIKTRSCPTTNAPSNGPASFRWAANTASRSTTRQKTP